MFALLIPLFFAKRPDSMTRCTLKCMAGEQASDYFSCAKQCAASRSDESTGTEKPTGDLKIKPFRKNPIPIVEVDPEPAEEEDALTCERVCQGSVPPRFVSACKKGCNVPRIEYCNGMQQSTPYCKRGFNIARQFRNYAEEEDEEEDNSPEDQCYGMCVDRYHTKSEIRSCLAGCTLEVSCTKIPCHMGQQLRLRLEGMTNGLTDPRERFLACSKSCSGMRSSKDRKRCLNKCKHPL